MVKYEKMEMSTGKYKDALKIEDEGKQYPVFITERQGADITPQHTLTLDQLSQVYTMLALQFMRSYETAHSIVT